MPDVSTIITASVFVLLLVYCFLCFKVVGPTQVLLLEKRLGKSLADDNPVALRGEAGYQAALKMPGWRWVWWPFYSAQKHPMIQVPTGQIGVVVAQIGQSLRVDQRSALYKEKFGNFTDIQTFLEQGGQKGIQRPVLPPGTTLPIHPIAFLVLTKDRVFGRPILDELKGKSDDAIIKHFGLEPDELQQFKLEPYVRKNGTLLDICGVITTLEGDPIPEGAIAGRIGGFSDIKEFETEGRGPGDTIELLISPKNELHNNYQDFQKFLTAGGHIGLQHDVLLYGAYNLNPFLVRVEKVPMLVVEQGEVAVIKAYVGLATEDTSGEGFKHGSIVKPGHRGIWEEPLRTGKYAINPRCYQAEIVPTKIVTLNWAEAVSKAHEFDAGLSQIKAKSREGFVFGIDLQVQIHVPDTMAAKVISSVGTMAALVDEVLQAAVGNHFRDKLQSMQAVSFINERQRVQEEAFAHIGAKLKQYYIETPGVYIQDVTFPTELVKVLTEREIAAQEVETFKHQQRAQQQRIETEAARGRADQQADLARSEIGVKISQNDSEARKAQADGESTYIQKLGDAAGAKELSIGMARAKAYDAQVKALGQDATTLVNLVNALAEHGIKIVPDVQVTDSAGAGALNGLLGTLTGALNDGGRFGFGRPADTKTASQTGKDSSGKADDVADDMDLARPKEDRAEEDVASAPTVDPSILPKSQD